MSETEKILKFENKKIILIGTAHISEQSIEDVRNKIETVKPDFVGIELDEGRFSTLKNPKSWQNLNIVEVLKRGQGFLLLANIILSSFQKRMGKNVQVKPGDEMRAGIDSAEKLGIQTVLIDRPIQTTLSRAWGKNSLWGKAKLLAALISSAFSNEKISKEEIENLKNSNELDSMLSELSKYLPNVKKVLIDERDQYLACKIWETCKKHDNDEETTFLAVLGAGHLPGVTKHLELLANNKESTNTDEISKLPKQSFARKIAGFIFPIAIVGLIVAGFFAGGANMSKKMLLQWLVFNSSLAFLGTLLALGHPLTLLTAIIGAPIGTMSPVLGVGLFTSLVEAVVKKPRVIDLESVTDSLSFKGFYKNRVLHILLILILSSFGGALGNFIAVPSLISKLFG